MHSKSRNKFKERIGEIKILQEYVDSITAITELARKRESAIHRASLVMLCSHFEGYVEDRILEFIDDIKFSKIKCIRIPPQLKVSLCKPGIKSLENKDPNVLIDRIPRFIEQYIEMWDNDKVLEAKDFPVIDDDDWKIGNPGSKVLEKNFKKIGINKIWQEIESKNTTIKADLDALVLRRNEIAHGNIEMTATSVDVERYVKSISELIGRLDAITYRHFRNVIYINQEVFESLIESYYNGMDSL